MTEPITKDYVKGVLAGADYEHKRIVNIIEDLDLSEFDKDLIIHGIAR